MRAIGLPLIHRDDNEKRGHGKVNAGGVKTDKGSGHTADDRAQDPIAVVQNGDGEIVGMGVHPFGDPGRGEERIGLVGQGEDHIELSKPHPPELFQHGEPVDQMAEVQDQRKHGHTSQRRAGGQEFHPHILS